MKEKNEIEKHQAAKKYHEGQDLALRGRYEEAIEAYNKAIELNGNNIDVLSAKMISELQLERLEEAIECYDNAMDIYKSDVDGDHNEWSKYIIRQMELRIEAAAINYNNDGCSLSMRRQYEGALQEEADECTRIMHGAINKKAMLQQYLESSMKYIEYKKPPADTELDWLYEQLGVHFSQNVKKTLLEARTFHEKIVKDRERFLRAETVSLRNRIEDLDTTIRNAEDKRAEVMTILKDHGALEEFYKLQARLLTKQQKLSEISIILGNITNEVSRRTQTVRNQTELHL